MFDNKMPPPAVTIPESPQGTRRGSKILTAGRGATSRIRGYRTGPSPWSERGEEGNKQQQEGGGERGQLPPAAGGHTPSCREGTAAEGGAPHRGPYETPPEGGRPGAATERRAARRSPASPRICSAPRRSSRSCAPPAAGARPGGTAAPPPSRCCCCWSRGGGDSAGTAPGGRGARSTCGARRTRHHQLPPYRRHGKRGRPAPSDYSSRRAQRRPAPALPDYSSRRAQRRPPLPPRAPSGSGARLSRWLGALGAPACAASSASPALCSPESHLPPLPQDSPAREPFNSGAGRRRRAGGDGGGSGWPRLGLQERYAPGGGRSRRPSAAVGR